MSGNSRAPKEPKEGVRKRRVHTKSRKGCRNCKLRRVKCDEIRPNCVKCRHYGYSCNYDSKIPDLQMALSGSEATIDPQSPQRGVAITPWVSIIPGQKSSVPMILEPPITIGDDISSLQLDRQHLSRLDRFKHRTVFLTLGTPVTAAIFHDVAFSMAFNHPFLMHAVQSLTVAHDRHLAPPTPLTCKASITEAYHLSSAASLFNQKLLNPIERKDCDALWAAAALLGISSLSAIEACTPYEAWPLTPYSDTDLDWLRMSELKSTIWNLTDPSRPDSIFHPLADLYRTAKSSVSLFSLSVLPPQLVQLCEINESSPTDNPYYTALSDLSTLMNTESERVTALVFLKFLNNITSRFKALLKARDPRALLLVAYWYAKVRKIVWWIERRATLECQAICIYLERHHIDNPLIMKLLGFPKKECGLTENV